MWNTELSINLNVLIGYLEIALRNSVHRTLSSFVSNGASNSIHWYDNSRANLTTDSKRKITDIRTDKRTHTPISPAPSPDEIISRLTFGFWPNALNSLDKRYTNTTLASIFPNHLFTQNPTLWNFKANIKTVISPLYEINTLRNRIAHHESVWKFSSVNDGNIVLQQESKNITDSIARFTRFLNQYDEVIRAIDLDLYNDLLNSSWRNKVEFLLSPKGVDRYKCAKNNIAATKTAACLKYKFLKIVNQNQPILVKYRGEKGLFHPL